MNPQHLKIIDYCWLGNAIIQKEGKKEEKLA